ncbi:hypothetical protein Pfo_000111 [Paulownia fortunei]|nr:hypothetical protein Pfo_000111 [Paulownia fortunei]
MALKAFSFRKLVLIFSVLLNHFRNPRRNLGKNFCSGSAASQVEFQKFQFLGQRPDLEDQVLVFNVERALLKSSSLFPYFMLVAFEAGSLVRALILFVLYPFISLFHEDFAFKVMVMVCFIGLKKERFIEGRAVLPKFFLEDVGMECFQVLRRGNKTVALSDLPRVMVESFLTDYLNIDFVVGRDLKVFHGYFVGLMEERSELFLGENSFQVANIITSNAIGVGSFKQSFDCQWFSNCKEIYLVSGQERRSWHQLPRDLYPKPLIFHDGRLAFRPTFWATLAMFMWLPMGFTLAIIKIVIALTLPSKIVVPIMHFSGLQLRVFNPKNLVSPLKEKGNKVNGDLYVCNHRTLLDPILISYSLGTPLTGVTYGISRMSEIISLIKTVRLTRNRDQDAELMHKVLSQGDLVVCPEGTTCREQYLLRFSPLFAEINDNIHPVAVDCDVSMFYGTTARGSKCLDPLFFFMNPRASYTVRLLDVVRCATESVGDDNGNSKFRVANFVQNEIAKALGFTCTKLTRKDKYLILAGNEGTV